MCRTTQALSVSVFVYTLEFEFISPGMVEFNVLSVCLSLCSLWVSKTKQILDIHSLHLSISARKNCRRYSRRSIKIGREAPITNFNMEEVFLLLIENTAPDYTLFRQPDRR